MKSHAQTREVSRTLAELFALRAGDVKLRPGAPNGADLVLEAARHTFVIAFKQKPSAATLSGAVEQVMEVARGFRRRVIPLVAVPYMSELGRRICEDSGVSWLDLSGNAHIAARGLRIHVEGRPNRFRVVGRPPDVFAPRSSRVVRWLLMHSDEPLAQREIARATGMNEGFVSRIVSRLEGEGFITRDEGGRVSPKDPSLLLDAWRERYAFSKHEVLRGHVAARGGDALARFVSDSLARARVEHAMTGLAAAWALTKFAAFRTVTTFLSEPLSPALREKMGFRATDRGSNLWLVVPNDAGVFHGADDRDGVRCVHPVQVYLDLRDQPERSKEAAESVRREFLRWRRRA
jgi:DNA-binding Lrp family transcriptional regulator